MPFLQRAYIRVNEQLLRQTATLRAQLGASPPTLVLQYSFAWRGSHRHGHKYRRRIVLVLRALRV